MKKAKIVTREHMPHIVACLVLILFTLPICLLCKQYEKTQNSYEVTHTLCETQEHTEIFSETQTETTAKNYYVMAVTATAYCPCEKCCGKSDGITASGTKATAGRTIAVDPKIIPYGTEVVIDGHTYIAEDCGSAVKGNKVDIFFDSHEEALAFGRQVMEIEVEK